MRSPGWVWYSPLALETNTPTAANRGRSPSVAALLSFLWPGLGQLYAGKRRLASIFAIPALLLLPILAYQLRQGPLAFGTRFLDPTYCLYALVIVVVLGVWRFASVTQVFVGRARSKNRRMLDRLVLAALVAIIILSHAYTGLLLATTYNADDRAASQENGLGDLATPDPSSLAGVSFLPTGTPRPSSTAGASGRVTMLITGMDAAPSSGRKDRNDMHYDSIMVVSFDPKTNSIQMVSVPREFAGEPFYFGGRDLLVENHEITYLPKNAKNGYVISPDSPYLTLVNEVSYLVGIPIDYWAIMNLDGFVKMINAVGGVDVNNPTVINCGGFDWLDGHYGVYIGAGWQHLDGKYAMAYARERTCDSDYKRAARQQQVMRALLAKMSQPGMIFQLPGLISTYGNSVQYSPNFKPTSDVAKYVAAAQNVPDGNFTNIVLAPPQFANKTTNASVCPIMPALAAESISLFGQDSLWYGVPTPRN